MSTSREVADNAIRQAQARANNPAEVWGIDWEVAGLNQATGGIHPERFVLLTSRPSVGKSAFAGRLLISVAKQFLEDDTDSVVKMFTLEMSQDSVQKRLACQMAKVPIHKIDTGFATPDQLARYNAAQEILADLPIEYFDGNMSLTEVEREVARANTGWWILDHTGNLSDLDGVPNPYIVYGDLAKRLQRICQKVRSGLIIHHQNRSKQGAVDKRADLESLAGNDAFGKLSDLALGLYREDIGKYVSEEERDLPKPAELLVIKNKYGPQGFAKPL